MTVSLSRLGSSFSKRIASVLFISFFLISCSKKDGVDEPEITRSEANELAAIAIKAANNPGMTEDAFVARGKTLIYVTLPTGSNLAAVKAEFDAPDKSTIEVNGQKLSGHSGTINMTNTLQVTITSEAGTKKSYTVLAQEGKKDLDKLIYNFKEKYSIPGISIAISKTQESRIVYRSGIGFAIEENQVRVKPDHLFRLASASKQFTSLCIMKLVQAGKLTIDSKVFGPGGILESDFSNISVKAAKVTVRNLLEHTTGWTSDPDPMFTGSFAGQTLTQRINYMLTSTQAEPSTKFSYYNMGFGTLGKVIEKLSGKTYEVYLKEVLAEAGITDIHVGGNKSQRRTNEVVYYSQDGSNGYANDMQVIAAAGGVIASPEQMLKMLYAIDGRSNIPDILTPEIRTAMLTPSKVYDRYALGWRTNHSYFPNSWYHGGNLSGTAVLWVMGPEINCVVLCNSRSNIGGFDDELFGVLRDLINTASTINWE